MRHALMRGGDVIRGGRRRGHVLPGVRSVGEHALDLGGLHFRGGDRLGAVGIRLLDDVLLDARSVGEVGLAGGLLLRGGRHGDGLCCAM